MAQRRSLALQMQQLECGIQTLLAGEPQSFMHLSMNWKSLFPKNVALCILLVFIRVNCECRGLKGLKSLGIVTNTIVSLYATMYSSYGQLIYTMKQSRSPVLSMCWCDEMNIAIGYKGGDVCRVNVISAEILHTFQDRNGGITTMAYVECENRCVCVCVCVCTCVCVYVQVCVFK